MMAFDPYPQRRPAPAFAFMMSWGGRPRTLKLGRATGFALFVILPCLAVWYLGATAYLVFHDQLLASLISRQADIQYSYEDRIAVLKTQLDRSSSRALVDRQTLTTTIRDLASRSEQLEARAVTIDGLMNGLRAFAPGSKTPRDSANPLLSSTPAPLPEDASAFDLPATSPLSLGRVPASSLRLDGSSGHGSSNDGSSSHGSSDQSRNESQDSGPQVENHAELSPEQQGERLAMVLSSVEARQSEQVGRLRDPMLRSVERLQTALAETGLPLSRWNMRSKSHLDVGGPFVPLSDDASASSFEQNVALLQSAVVQQARLTSIVDTVPLRRPLAGALEVTSPFGARLDPFYGRAAMHTGVDLMQPYGGPVMATASGIISVAGSEGGYGNMVEIDHGNGVVTRYAHLSAIDVVLHQKVAAGTIVGRVGSTGRATGPHLHYETRINGEPVDPTRFLKAGAVLFRG